jgi:response regulator RpfG family c-di-GMP phosphodiesterase
VSTTIVLLDDDERIFKAISRLVRPLDALVMSTASADRAYEFCEAGAQILITDINRPDIDVPSLLKRVTLANPSIRKIVLTSYADLEQTIDSINTGKIHRYFTKPWDAEELRSALVEELDAYTAHQNRENESLNFGQKVQSYEQKANFTAMLLEGTTDYLANARHRIAVEMLLSLLDQRKPGAKGFALRVEALCRRLMDLKGLNREIKEQVMLAAQLHQIGLLALTDDVITENPLKISLKNKKKYRTYPARGAEILAERAQEDAVATIIRHHRENFRGDGYPDQLVASYIPVGARILRVATDFQYISEHYGLEKATCLLNKYQGTHYDPEYVALLPQITPDSELTIMNGDI